MACVLRVDIADHVDKTGHFKGTAADGQGSSEARQER